MKAHLINTHLLVSRSRSSAKVKVKYQGDVSRKMGVSGALVFHKHILFSSVICEGIPQKYRKTNAIKCRKIELFLFFLQWLHVLKRRCIPREVRLLFLLLYKAFEIFSSPEHKVLRVSYCAHSLSVGVCRLSVPLSSFYISLFTLQHLQILTNHHQTWSKCI